MFSDYINITTFFPFLALIMYRQMRDCFSRKKKSVIGKSKLQNKRQETKTHERKLRTSFELI